MKGYAYIDTETTGFRSTDEVLQMAVVQLDAQGEIESTWSTLVNPHLAFIPHYDIHKITPAEVAGAPSIDEALDLLAPRVAGRTLAAHNYAFDQRMVNAAAARAGHRLRLPDGICTVELARQHLPGPFKLGVLCRRLGIDLSDAHNASADALAGAHLLRYLLGLEPDRTLPVLDWLARLAESAQAPNNRLSASQTAA